MMLIEMTANLRAARLLLRNAHYQEIPLPATDFSNPSRLSSGLRYGFFATTGVAGLTGAFGRLGSVLLERCIIGFLFESLGLIGVIAGCRVRRTAMGWKAGSTFRC